MGYWDIPPKPYKGNRLEVPGENPGEVIHLPKTVYEKLIKKVNVVSMVPVGPKIVIEYYAKRGGGFGRAELYDIGPMPAKKAR